MFDLRPRSGVSTTDPDIWRALEAERQRQEQHLELIASENYVSPAVLEVQGSVLTNKYAEGYPGRRYYGGCEHVDAAEQLAIDRVKQIFGAEYANVQPHSGSQANQAVYFATLEPGDTILGMSLAHGGHLTHGASVNLSGRIFNAVTYGLGSDERIDYDDIAAKARVASPKLIVAGASAYSRVIDFARFRKIADDVGALLMVDMAHYAGLVAAGVYPNPVPYADFVTSTTHKTLRGPRGGFVLARARHAKALDSSVFPRLQGGPLMHVIAAKAVAFREARSSGFAQYAKQVVSNARALAQGLERRGMRIVSGGTDCHMFLVDLRSRGITGKEAEAALGEAFITVNKNAIPGDPQKPTVTSGIRIGTAAATTRGMGEGAMVEIAACIADVLESPKDSARVHRIRERVMALCRGHPVYH